MSSRVGKLSIFLAPWKKHPLFTGHSRTREQSFAHLLKRIDPPVRPYIYVSYFGIERLFHPVDRAKATQQCPPS